MARFGERRGQVVNEQDRAVLVIGDMLSAAADDLNVALTSRDARRLAPHVVELLNLAGYQITYDNERNRP
jgi:hypothetical protein